MGNFIHISDAFSATQNKVQLASEDVMRLEEELEKAYNEYRYQMGETKDLSVLDEKYASGMEALKNLGNAMDNYWKIMAQIRANYRNAQEEAIYRALKIPRILLY